MKHMYDVRRATTMAIILQFFMKSGKRPKWPAYELHITDIAFGHRTQFAYIHIK